MSLAVDVATNLRAIEDMATRLAERAIDRASDKSMPGGDAMVELAGVGSIRDWERRIEIGERLHEEDPRIERPDITNEDPDQLWPALEVLWWWTEDYRSQLGMDYDDPRWRPSLVSEARFLRNQDVAVWIWDNEVRYEDYAKDVARAKSKLESILHEGERDDRTPVICDRCDDARPLVKVWGDSPSEDRWKCMGCKHQFTQEEHEDALATQMRRGSSREWVSRTQAVDLLRSLGHQERVAKRLVDDPETLGWCELLTHTRWISWPDAWRRHLLAEQEKVMRIKRAKGRKLTA